MSPLKDKSSSKSASDKKIKSKVSVKKDKSSSKSTSDKKIKSKVSVKKDKSSSKSSSDKKIKSKVSVKKDTKKTTTKKIIKSSLSHKKSLKNKITKVGGTEPKNINKKNENGNTPLILSINNNDPKTFLDLINNGANVNLPNSTGDTPLYFAVQKYKEIKATLNDPTKYHEGMNNISLIISILIDRVEFIDIKSLQYFGETYKNNVSRQVFSTDPTEVLIKTVRYYYSKGKGSEEDKKLLKEIIKKFYKGNKDYNFKVNNFISSKILKETILDKIKKFF